MAHAKECRRRLMNPPNSVKDLGIDLKRKPGQSIPTSASDLPIPIPPLSDFPEIKMSKASLGLVDLPTIIRAVSAYYCVGIGDIKSESRRRAVTVPRHVVAHLADKFIYPKIGETLMGELLGGRDRTTILYGKARVEKLINDGVLTKDVAAIEVSIRAGNYD